MSKSDSPRAPRASAPRSSAKRAAILEAAGLCFMEHGYAATSMDMVAARANVSKATIYAHFSGKDELFGAIITDRCNSQLSMELLTPASGGDPRAALTAIARRLLELLMQPASMAIYRVVVAESARYPDLARAYYEAGPMRGKAAIAHALAELDRRGQLRIADGWRAADLFIGMLRGEFYNRALLGLPQVDGRGIEETIAAAVECMIRAFPPA